MNCKTELIVILTLVTSQPKSTDDELPVIYCLWCSSMNLLMLSTVAPKAIEASSLLAKNELSVAKTRELYFLHNFP